MGIGAGMSRITLRKLKENLVRIAQLLTHPQGLLHSGVVRLNDLHPLVHVFSVRLGVTEGVGEGGDFGVEVLNALLEVIVLHLEAFDQVTGRGAAMGDQALDDVLHTVAVLEGVHQG